MLTEEAWEALTLQEQQVPRAGLYAVRRIDGSNRGDPAVTQLPLNVPAHAGLKHFGVDNAPQSTQHGCGCGRTERAMLQCILR